MRGSEDFDDDDDENFAIRRRRRRPKPDPNRFPKVPSDAGTELMNSGDFGTNDNQRASSTPQKKRLAARILERELGVGSRASQKANQRLMTQVFNSFLKTETVSNSEKGMIPSSNADMIIHYDAPVYSGQFSDDGNFFFSCVKDFRVRMYNTSNPYQWKYYKTVDYPFGQWTLTDATLTPDNKYLAYASIQPKVCLAPTDPNDLGDPYTLDLSDNGRRGAGHSNLHHGFGIWSIRFSGDGRELVAGTSANSIVVYDVEARRSVVEIRGHDDDVNAVCFGDQSSPHILYSGSDDTTLKVWDRRSMGDSREAGAFVGHTEGLTYIDSKGDGRYILSNSKDQTAKLWDLRMVMTTAQFTQIDTGAYTSGFDYRWGEYDLDDWKPHPHDNSLVTFRSHRVLRTLIRCHFSPPGSTNSRYVYSGSEDGKVYIYNLDATLAGKIDVMEATRDSRPYDYPPRLHDYHVEQRRANWKTCVRDASWHPNAPVIAGKSISDWCYADILIILASSWNGYGFQSGTVSVHSWNDGAEDDEAEPKMGMNVNDKLEDDSALHSPPRRGYLDFARRAARYDD